MTAYQDFIEHHGVYPPGETRTWEELEPMRKRFRSVLERYAHLESLIVVSHSVAITGFVGIRHDQAPARGEILEWRAPR